MKTQTENKRAFRLIPHEWALNQDIAIEKFLEDEGYFFEKDIFFPYARRLTQGPKALGSSLAHQFGYIYIQDRASMLPPVALNPPRNSIILDMCASPGSKTTMLSAMTGVGGLVLANEVNPTRLTTLKRNLEATLSFNTLTCNYNAAALPLPDKSIPYILLDPPCSGWGTVEKNPQVEKIWTAQKAKTLVGLQKQLLTEAERILAPGGEITYSTCTTNVQENEEQVEFALNELNLELVPLAPLPDFVHAPSSYEGVWRFVPQLGDTQGFFVAKFRKKNVLPEFPSFPLPVSSASSGSSYLEELFQGKFIQDSRYTSFFPEKGEYLKTQAPQLKFQCPMVGKTTAQGNVFTSKLPIPQPDSAFRITFSGKEGIAEIRRLLSGQSLTAEPEYPPFVPFYYETLPLGFLACKGKRLLFSA